MQRLADWIDIFSPHAAREETVTLSVSEVTRLVFDLQAASRPHSWEGAQNMFGREKIIGEVRQVTVTGVRCIAGGRYCKHDHCRKPGRVLVQVAGHDWIPHFHVWDKLGWSRWSRQRMAATLATAPKEVRIVIRRDGSVFLYSAEEQAWAKRIQQVLREKPKADEEPSAAEVQADSAVITLDSVTVAPFVINVYVN